MSIDEEALNEAGGDTDRLTVFLDRAVYGLARHWLLALNLVVAIYVGLPILAPVLMQAGLERPARVIYTLYSPMCHQMASRSFFLFGEQYAYPREIAGTELTPIEAYMPALPEFAGASTDAAEWATFLMPARQFVGNETMGYKMALCERDISIYLAVLVGGLVFGLLRRFRNVKPMPFWLFVLVCLLPIALDGFSQLFSQIFVGIPALQSGLAFLALRESTPLLRTVTGALFGLGIVAVAYPRLNDQFRYMALTQARKLGRIS